jgi:hypothetical protein
MCGDRLSLRSEPGVDAGPPAENRVKVAVRAGEKVFEGSGHE